MRIQGGIRHQEGDGDGAKEAQKKYPGNIDGADKAWWQRSGDGDGVNGATVPPQEADGAESGGNRGAVGCRRRGSPEILRSVVAPAAMVATIAHPER